MSSAREQLVEVFGEPQKEASTRSGKEQTTSMQPCGKLPGSTLLGLLQFARGDEEQAEGA